MNGDRGTQRKKDLILPLVFLGVFLTGGMLLTGCAGREQADVLTRAEASAQSLDVRETGREGRTVWGFSNGMESLKKDAGDAEEETTIRPEDVEGGSEGAEATPGESETQAGEAPPEGVDSQPGQAEPNTEASPVESRRTGGVEEILADMTLEEKIYQMFIVTPEQLTGVSGVTAAGDTTRTRLSQYPVGGLIYFAANLVSPDQTREMLAATQSFSYEIEGLPLFLCVDEEGGRVARVAKNGAFGVEQIGPMAGVTSEEEAYRCGAVIGSYLRELGFNVDFAPDADVITNPNNSAIGDRSFGTDAGIVTNYAVAYSNGLRAQGVCSTFKHFPGHGATEGDTHNGYAYTNRSYEELMGAELRPFAAAQGSGVDLVMAAHISVPAITGEGTPCSLSERMLTGILRNDLNFQGLIVTDALNMGAIAANYDSQTAAVCAVRAGADLLLMPKDLEAAFSGIYNAVQNGEISEARIDESVRRILSKKKEIAAR